MAIASSTQPRQQTSRRGRVRGRPRRLATRTVASVASARRTSARWALAGCIPIGTPCPSVCSISLVPLPLRVRPTPCPLFWPARTCQPNRLPPSAAAAGLPARREPPATLAPGCRPLPRAATAATPVEPSPNSRGTSPHRQPERSTSSIASSVRRSSARGRPATECGGKGGANSAHWASRRRRGTQNTKLLKPAPPFAMASSHTPRHQPEDRRQVAQTRHHDRCAAGACAGFGGVDARTGSRYRRLPALHAAAAR